MSSLLESYEHQYSGLTADITVKVGKIAKTYGGEKQLIVAKVDKLFEEAHELLEQMGLEVQEQQPKERQKYQTRIKSYKTELGKLEKDMKKAKLGLDFREELLGDDSHYSEDQRARLLDNTDSMDRTTRQLEHGYRAAIETEEIGAQIMEDLQNQRQTINRSRGRLEEMDTSLGKSSRVLSGMLRRIIQNRILLIGVGLFILVVIGLAIYFTVQKNS